VASPQRFGIDQLDLDRAPASGSGTGPRDQASSAARRQMQKVLLRVSNAGSSRKLARNSVGNASNMPGQGSSIRYSAASCARPWSAMPAGQSSANQWSPEPLRIEAIISPVAQCESNE